jgi:hypothetical protein
MTPRYRHSFAPKASRAVQPPAFFQHRPQSLTQIEPLWGRMRQNVNRYVNRVWRTSSEFIGFPHGQSNKVWRTQWQESRHFLECRRQRPKDGWHAARPRCRVVRSVRWKAASATSCPRTNTDHGITRSRPMELAACAPRWASLTERNSQPVRLFVQSIFAKIRNKDRKGQQS